MLNSAKLGSAFKSSILLGVFAFGSLVSVTANAETDGDYSELIGNTLDQSGIPGAAIVVIRPDAPAIIKGFGVKALGDAGEVNKDTLFQVNSITKSFSSISIASAAESSDFTVSSPVQELDPSFQLKDPWVSRQITIEDLLSHRTGLNPIEWVQDIPAMTPEDIMFNLRYMDAKHDFRTEFQYDNYLFATAAHVVARERGGWRAFLQSEFFDRVGMKRSITSIHDKVREEELTKCHECELDHPPKGLAALMDDLNVAAPHYYKNDEMVLSHWRGPKVGGPSGNAWSTASDMHRYLTLLLQDGVLEGEQVFPSSVLEEVTTIRTVKEPASWVNFLGVAGLSKPFIRRLTEYMDMDYALGLNVGEYQGRQVIQHGGASIGFKSQMVISQSDGVAVFVVVNARDGLPDYVRGLAMEIFDREIGLESADWVSNEVKLATLRNAMAATQNGSIAALESSDEIVDLSTVLEGQYSHPAFGTIEIRINESGDPYVWHGVGRTGTLTALGEMRFELRWRGVRDEPELLSFNLGNGVEQADSLILREELFSRDG